MSYKLNFDLDGSSFAVRENLADILKRELLGPIHGPEELLPFSPRSHAFAWSRLAILAVAVYSALAVGSGGVPAANEHRYDDPALTQALGGFGDVVLSPLAHWDAVWFLGIADTGYDSADSPRTAFFPLYPLLTRGVAELGGGSRGALLIASYLVSLAALLAALVLYTAHLARARAPRRRARGGAAVRVPGLALPGRALLGEPLPAVLGWRVLRRPDGQLGVGGRRRRRRLGHPQRRAAAAAPPGADPSLRPALGQTGRGGALRARGWPASLRPVHTVRRDFAWLALAPLGLVAYGAWLGIEHGDATAFLGAQEFWGREFAGPLVGVWDGASAAFDGMRQLLSGSTDTVYFEQAGGDPMRVAAINLMLFGFLCFGLVAAVGVLRRLPFAYGAYVIAALMLPLSYPVEPQPLMSLPRFLLVLFPIFMWLAATAEERGATTRYVAVSAVGLGLLTQQFAGWYFIA